MMSHLIWIYPVCKFNYFDFWHFKYKYSSNIEVDHYKFSQIENLIIVLILCNFVTKARIRTIIVS